MLLNGDPQEITHLLRSMESDRQKLESDLAKLVFHMNGGISFVDAYNLSTDQMTILIEAINQHNQAQTDALRGRSKSSMSG